MCGGAGPVLVGDEGGIVGVVDGSVEGLSLGSVVGYIDGGIYGVSLG